MLGSQVSHYRLVRKLGAGTYGEVWEAEHVRSPNLRVAVKIVAPALGQDASFVDALTRECLQLDKLDHPNVVRFRDLVVNEGQVAMVLELLDGQDLHERLVGGPLTIDSAVAVVEGMLEGLAHAHARGVLHRDIKPGNVFWCDDGRVKLLDFGIARAADGTQATKTGHMVGTFDYMAPERFTGDGGSAASDVYAVGLIAWELFSGRPACPEGEPGRKMGWHVAQGVGDAAKVAGTLPGCPSWFAEVIATLAAKDPAERPADGAAALALLREKRAGAGTTPAVAAPGRRAPPSTVMGPVAMGSVPPVASSVPPVASSVPPGRSAPPVPVGSTPPGSARRSAPPVMPPAGSEPPAPSAPASGASKLPLLVGGAVVIVAVAWFALRGPSAASIELEPSGPVYVRVGESAAAPAARALDAKGNVVAGVQVVCTSDTPAVRLRDGKLSATEAAEATVTCAGGGGTATYAVKVMAPVRSASIDYELLPIPGGTFSMGSPASEAGRWVDETQHEVTLSHAYWMGTTEVTQAQWETVMGSNPSAKEYSSVSLLNPSYPVQNVSWCDVVVFANKLSEKDGLTAAYNLPGGMSAVLEWEACNDLAPKVTVNAGGDGYRLPTEEEWERAARGGTTDTWSGANREEDLCGVANVADASRVPMQLPGDQVACNDHRVALAPVGSYTANAYGLKDMSGNVWEWTGDTFGDYPAGSASGAQGAVTGHASGAGLWLSGVQSAQAGFIPDPVGRVNRGGSWLQTAGDARAANRDSDGPGDRVINLGFRLSRTIP
jgi:serine/threonine-protein kinase